MDIEKVKLFCEKNLGGMNSGVCEKCKAIVINGDQTKCPSCQKFYCERCHGKYVSKQDNPICDDCF